ncbi:unnamed protein product [Adineta ricciae]|uniref:Uncharacterized protein n=1 Tax=Adineta ricciae TaxID=249248 RepID=A0A814U9T7_ADIRI|nr:unnamed protein product [Adineta ricciae]
MRSLASLLFSAFLCTTVTSTSINEHIHLQHHKSKLGSTNRTLTWKLTRDHLLTDATNARQSILQALHGEVESAMADGSRSRFARSTKWKKNKRKSKRPTGTSEEDVILNTDAHLLKFTRSHQDRIKTVIRELQPDNGLLIFKRLSQVISMATGTLPKKLMPSLQRLSNSHSKTTKRVKDGLAVLSAVLSKFVIKSWWIIQRGMNREDEDALKTLTNQLNITFKDELAKFTELSSKDIFNIYSQLFLERINNDETQKLLEKRRSLDADLSEQKAKLTNKYFEWSANEGQIEYIKDLKRFNDLAILNSKKARLAMRTELSRLKAQIPDYQAKVKPHSGNYTEEPQGIGLLSWNVQTFYIDTGETIARENLNRLLNRIRFLEEKYKNWSSTRLIKQRRKTASELKKYEERKVQLEHEQNEFQKQYNKTKQEFDTIIQQIDRLHLSIRPADTDNTKLVHDLWYALQTGSNTLISACNSIQNHLNIFDVDSKFLVDAVVDALKLINITDEYNDSTMIKDIKRVLEIG